ncbi:hypothetical protein IH992_13525 [Candidatus Poribacteria bacterium]|nr:hypothetical protein [Candidatus Poribacteria bacterium]
MDVFNDFEFKQQKYMPVFPKAVGKSTVYVEGYPYEDDEPMAATGFHAEQITTFSRQLKTHFGTDNLIYVGIDTFIYYQEGDATKFVAPDIYVVLGVEAFERRSFYTWAEGTAPHVVFEFLSESTAARARGEKVKQYLLDIGVQEYFVHQPERAKPPEFRGWRRSSSGEIDEMTPDAEGRLFSFVLNLWFRWVDLPYLRVRLLRPYLPDGTPIPTPSEWKAIAEGAEQHRQEAEAIAQEETQHRQEAEAIAQEETQHRQEAEAIAQEETQRRQEAETIVQEETQRRQEAEAIAQEEAQRRRETEAAAQEETQQRHQLESKLQQLYAELATLRGEKTE